MMRLNDSQGSTVESQLCLCVFVCVDLPRRHQEDIWRVHRKQRLLFQCLCQVSWRVYLSWCWLLCFTQYSHFQPRVCPHPKGTRKGLAFIFGDVSWLP